MNIQETIKTDSYLHANTAEALDFVRQRRQPVIITQNGDVSAVLIDLESYQSMKDAINMLRLIKFSESDIAKGNYKPAEDFFSSLKARYGING